MCCTGRSEASWPGLVPRLVWPFFGRAGTVDAIPGTDGPTVTGTDKRRTRTPDAVSGLSSGLAICQA